MPFPSEYPPEPTPGYGEERIEDEDYDLHGLAPTQVTMVTEEVFPYAATAEPHYAKEDTDTMQVRHGTFSGTMLLFLVAKPFESSSFECGLRFTSIQRRTRRRLRAALTSGQGGQQSATASLASLDLLVLQDQRCCVMWSGKY